MGYDPRKLFDAKRGIFIGLNERRRPLYIELAQWRKSHVQVLGTTGSGKGVAAGVLLYQAVQQGDEALQVRPHFEPSKLAPVSVAHHLDIQMARLQAERQGWTGWVPGDRLPAGLVMRPDAVAVDPQGNRIAIEIERHVKTLAL